MSNYGTFENIMSAGFMIQTVAKPDTIQVARNEGAFYYNDGDSYYEWGEERTGNEPTLLAIQGEGPQQARRIIRALKELHRPVSLSDAEDWSIQFPLRWLMGDEAEGILTWEDICRTPRVTWPYS